MSARNALMITFLVLAALAAGWWGRGLNGKSAPTHGSAAPSSADAPCPGGAQPLYWRAPMDPNFVREGPGKSPMGMDLVPECPRSPGDQPPAGAGVVIDAATIQNIGVRTTRVERRDLARSVRAVGRVATDERRVAHVHTKVQGWVDRLYIDFVGQEVTRGRPLLEIYSPSLVATQEELLLAARYRESTEASPFPDVRESGESLFDAARKRLSLWDISEEEIDRLLQSGEGQRTLTLHAPVSGVVTQLGVRAGMEVGPNSNLYTIADLSRVWVLADVYEYELPWLELGQMARVELGSWPGEPVQGELTYIAPFLDPKTRTAEVRLEIENAEGRLKPEMFGNVVITGKSHPDVIAIPTNAIIRSGARSIAIVALGSGRFEPREVTLGLDAGDGWTEVRSGLEVGEEVVVSSQFLIDSESNFREAVQKLLTRSPNGASSSEPSSPPPNDPSESHEMHHAPVEDERRHEAGNDHHDHAHPMMGGK